MRTANSSKSGSSARSHTAEPIHRPRYALPVSSFSLNFVAEFLLADSNLVGLFFDRALFFGRPVGQTRSVDSSPTGRNMTWRTPTWGRPLWTTTSSRVVAKPAAKQAAQGTESPSTTGRTTMRPKSPHAAGRHLDEARVPPLHRLLEAEGKSVAPPRVCSAVGRRNPGRRGSNQAGGGGREGGSLPQDGEATADRVGVSSLSFVYTFFFLFSGGP